MKRTFLFVNIIFICLLFGVSSVNATMECTGDYIMPPMGWRVRHWIQSEVNPLTGGTIIITRTTIEDGNGGLIYDQQTWSRKIGVNSTKIDDSNLISIYPNPTTNLITINSFNLMGQNIIVTLNNFNYKQTDVLFNSLCSSDIITIPLNDYPSGNYYLNITYAGSSITKQLILIK